MTASVRDRRGEHTPPEQGARARTADYECPECHGPAVAITTVWVEHDPECTIGQHVARVRAAAKARA